MSVHRYSGYGTDGSGDEVFHSYTGGDHLLAAPERSHSHPKIWFKREHNFKDSQTSKEAEFARHRSFRLHRDDGL